MKNLLKKTCALLVAAVILLSIPITARANQPGYIPVRSFFEAEGAAVEWYGPQQRVTITLDDNSIAFFIGSQNFYFNGIITWILYEPVVVFANSVTYMRACAAADFLYWLRFDFNEPTGIAPATYAYGQIAYRYLYFIEENLYSRIAFTYREYETARWIAAELAGMGHTDIQIQPFPISGAMQMVVSMLNLNCDPVDEIPDVLRGFLATQNIYTMDDILQHTFRGYSQNVILTVPGQSPRTIIVGAHYDSPNSPGISDNASGVVTLLESAYRILHKPQQYYTIKYIFFGAEEMGLLGVFHYVSTLSEEDIANIALMINVDVIFDGFDHTFGAGYHNPVTGAEGRNHVTQVLIDIANDLNDEFGLALTRAYNGIYVPSDQLAFLPLGVQVLVFYSMVNFEPGPWILGMFEEHVPLFTAERIALILAVLDECDDPETLAAAYADQEMMQLLISDISHRISRESALAQIEEMRAFIEDITDESFLAMVNYEIALLEGIIAIWEHPAFVPVEGPGPSAPVIPASADHPMTPERMTLIFAMLDGCDDEETLAAIEADRDMINYVLAEISALSMEYALTMIALQENMIANTEDEFLLAEFTFFLQIIETAIAVLEHPAFVPVEGRAPARLEPVRAASHGFHIMTEDGEVVVVMLNYIGGGIYALDENYAIKAEDFAFMVYLGDGLFTYAEGHVPAAYWADVAAAAPQPIDWVVISYEENEDGSVTKFVYWNGEYQYITVTVREEGLGGVAHPLQRGLVNHTLNDNMAYLNQNHPGLIQAALEAYLLFLQRVLTLPAGSLE